MSTKIEEFARQFLGFDLTPAQIQVIDAVSKGATEINRPRQAGTATAMLVAKEYLKDGLKEIELKPVLNKHGQPQGDFPKDIPTRADFDKYHAEPADYGEEGEWMIISKNVPAEKALAMIQKRLRDEYGMSEEFIPQSVDDLGTYQIGWGYDHDSYHYSEGGYWIASEGSNITPRWEAWGVTTE